MNTLYIHSSCGLKVFQNYCLIVIADNDKQQILKQLTSIFNPRHIFYFFNPTT